MKLEIKSDLIICIFCVYASTYLLKFIYNQIDTVVHSQSLMDVHRLARILSCRVGHRADVPPCDPRHKQEGRDAPCRDNACGR